MAPRTTGPSGTRRWILVAAVATALGAGLAALSWAPGRRTLPTVESGSTRCPAGGEPSPAASGAGPLVPEARYHMVQLCPAASPGGEWARFRVLDGRASAEIVARLNALPATPPAAGCRTAGDPVLLVLREGGSQIVIHLDTGPCGSASRAGTTRYGAADVLRLTAGLIARTDS